MFLIFILIITNSPISHPNPTVPIANRRKGASSGTPFRGGIGWNRRPDAAPYAHLNITIIMYLNTLHHGAGPAAPARYRHAIHPALSAVEPIQTAVRRPVASGPAACGGQPKRRIRPLARLPGWTGQPRSGTGCRRGPSGSQFCPRATRVWPPPPKGLHWLHGSRPEPGPRPARLRGPASRKPVPPAQGPSESWI